MIKRLVQYFKKRRERRLREKIALSIGANSSTQAIQAWVEYILYNKPTKEILLSAYERQRMKALSELLNNSDLES